MLKNFLILSLVIVDLSALMYEDAEDLNSKRWRVVSSQYKGRVTNIFDKNKMSRVIKLDGNGTKSIYRLPLSETLENIQMDSSFFSWEMNYSEDFVIIIVLNTLDGKRHLLYTPDEKNSFLQYGLGIIEKGKWKKYSRNLEKDLQLYEKDNKIISIKDFIIKGSGSIDNIQLKRLKSASIPPIIKKVVKKEPKVAIRDYSNDIVPVLKLKGKNPLVLKVGEEYVEPGASAKNRDGSDIDIKITDNIDILTDGEYTVIYFATNKLGNSSIDKRKVIVGKVRNKKSDDKINEQEMNCNKICDIPTDIVKDIPTINIEDLEDLKEMGHPIEEHPNEEEPIEVDRPAHPGM